MLCAYYQHSTMQHSCSRSALGIFRRLFFPFRKQRSGLGFAGTVPHKTASIGDFLDGIAQCDSGGIIGRDFAQYCGFARSSLAGGTASMRARPR